VNIKEMGDDTEDTQDDDVSNMLVRAGYLMGLSFRHEFGSDERNMLQRAARSLVCAVQLKDERDDRQARAETACRETAEACATILEAQRERDVMWAHAKTLVEFAKTAPGRLPGLVQDAINAIAKLDAVKP